MRSKRRRHVLHDAEPAQGGAGGDLHGAKGWVFSHPLAGQVGLDEMGAILMTRPPSRSSGSAACVTKATPFGMSIVPTRGRGVRSTRGWMRRCAHRARARAILV